MRGEFDREMSPAPRQRKTKSSAEALQALMRLCARGEKSTGDAMRLMRTWGVPENERQAVVDKLVAQRFIDNRRYAEAYQREKSQISGWGARKIATQLRSKGIERNIIEEVVNNIDESEQLNTLVKKLRSKGCTTPVLFLTARSATEDLVKGFEIGGNDYLKKPFAIDELIVRVRALAGRVSKDRTADATYRLGNYIYSPSAGTLEFAHDTTIKLAARENAVLLHLCRNMGNTVEASDILKELWGDDNFFNLRSLNVYISKLRNHLSKDPLVEITSIRGVGYRLETRK